MSQLKARVAAVWENNPPKRYLPRAINGGPAWEVWDAGKKYWVKDKELCSIPLETIKTEVIT